MKRKSLLSAFLLVFLGIFISAQAQDYAPPPVPAGQMLSAAQLDQLLGPIALYPDPLIAQILPACTQPAQIAIAYSYVSSGGDPNGIDQQTWDSSVKAVARYADVLKMLNDNMPWTTELGQAYLNQPDDVMSSIQSLRAQAQQLGNLQNLPQDNIVSDDGDIEILPADPDMFYIPQYDPSLVFYTPCYGQSFITFGVGFRFGPWFDHDFDWHGRRLITWGPGHPRPANWWHATPAARREAIARAPVWRAPARVAARPVVIRGGDRGFVNRDVHVEAPHPVEAHPAPRPVEVRPEPARPEPAHPVLAPREPARPAESAFGNESGGEARAASSRGVASRAVAAPPAPRGGGGGGGGGRRH
jgi:hypothetical protein